tara:strand:- start:35 stop:682 length:648 start_codon:yes stop_codon:yes gene_type:complete
MDMLRGQRVAVTGHTSGIGLEVYQYCLHHGADVRGYSRSNGFDLMKGGDDVLNDILKFDADIVFNHAWVPRVQNKIQKILHTQWKKHNNKVVISTGSATSYYSIGSDIYESDKTELREYSIQAAVSYPHTNKCRLHNVSMGWTNSAILDGVEDGEYFIDPYEAALILINLAQPQNYVVSEILVNAKFKPLKDMTLLRDKATANVLISLEKSNGNN